MSLQTPVKLSNPLVALRVRQAIARDLLEDDINEIALTATMADLGTSSIDFMSAIHEIEKEFAAELKSKRLSYDLYDRVKDLGDKITVGQLIAVVEVMLNADPR